MESLCDKMNTYGKSSDTTTGAVKYVRTSPREGEGSVSLENVSISGEVAEKLRFMVSVVYGTIGIVQVPCVLIINFSLDSLACSLTIADLLSSRLFYRFSVNT